MKKLAVALAATCTFLLAQPKTQTFERYFLPTSGDTVTIEKIDSMKIFLKKNGWDGKTFESLVQTIDRINFPHWYDGTDKNFSWKDAVEYGGLCTVGSTFLYTALEAAGLDPVIGVVRAAYVEISKKGGVVKLGAGIVPEVTSHMVCLVNVNGEIYAGAEKIRMIKGDTIDPIIARSVWDFAEGYKSVIIYPLMQAWPPEIENRTNVVDNYLRYKFENNLFIKINTDGFGPSQWKETWPVVVEYLKKDYVIIFTGGEGRW